MLTTHLIIHHLYDMVDMYHHLVLMYLVSSSTNTRIGYYTHSFIHSFIGMPWPKRCDNVIHPSTSLLCHWHGPCPSLILVSFCFSI
jgi:hypothetical protein